MSRLKTCRACREKFAAVRPMQVVCSPLCAAKHQRKQAEKARERERLERRRETREARERLKPRRKLMQEAQAAFNAWVRERDAGLPCPTCLRGEREVEADPPLRGGVWDCGHYLTVGAHPELRFEPDNAHRQCKACNRSGGHRRADYRETLVGRIGIERVEAIEAPHPPSKWSAEELREIRDGFRARLRELRSRRKLCAE